MNNEAFRPFGPKGLPVKRAFLAIVCVMILNTALAITLVGGVVYAAVFAYRLAMGGA